jgi:hypothetical protein
MSRILFYTTLLGCVGAYCDYGGTDANYYYYNQNAVNNYNQQVEAGQSQEHQKQQAPEMSDDSYWYY